jgi:hypothetical protein
LLRSPVDRRRVVEPGGHLDGTFDGQRIAGLRMSGTRADGSNVGDDPTAAEVER